MANFKRNKPRLRTSNRPSKRGWGTYFMNWWPAWWDIQFHRRPPRRRAKATERKIMKGFDPDVAVWPTEKKPHNYYW